MIKRYVNETPIRGFVHFENAQPVAFTFSRTLENGVERIPRYVEIDGKKYVRVCGNLNDPFEWLNLE